LFEWKLPVAVVELLDVRWETGELRLRSELSGLDGDAASNARCNGFPLMSCNQRHGIILADTGT
jgi:hypothetical protein